MRKVELIALRQWAFEQARITLTAQLQKPIVPWSQAIQDEADRLVEWATRPLRPARPDAS